MSERKAKPTAADRKAAAILKAEWEAAGRKPSQTAIGNALGITQGAVSQYLAGTIPMNYRTLLVFCQQLGIEDPRTVRDDLPEQQLAGVREDFSHYASTSQPARLDPDMVRATHELLRGAYADAGKHYDIEAEPDLFAIVYERLAALAGQPTLAEVVSIGRAIGERQQGATDDGENGPERPGVAHSGKGKQRAAG